MDKHRIVIAGLTRDLLVVAWKSRKPYPGEALAGAARSIATGGSLSSPEALLAQVPCTVAARAAALLEEGGHSGEGLVCLGRLPVFRD